MNAFRARTVVHASVMALFLPTPPPPSLALTPAPLSRSPRSVLPLPSRRLVTLLHGLPFCMSKRGDEKGTWPFKDKRRHPSRSAAEGRPGPFRNLRDIRTGRDSGTIVYTLPLCLQQRLANARWHPEWPRVRVTRPLAFLSYPRPAQLCLLVSSHLPSSFSWCAAKLHRAGAEKLAQTRTRPLLPGMYAGNLILFGQITSRSAHPHLGSPVSNTPSLHSHDFVKAQDLKRTRAMSKNQA